MPATAGIDPDARFGQRHNRHCRGLPAYRLRGHWRARVRGGGANRLPRLARAQELGCGRGHRRHDPAFEGSHLSALGVAALYPDRISRISRGTHVTAVRSGAPLVRLGSGWAGRCHGVRGGRLCGGVWCVDRDGGGVLQGRHPRHDAKRLRSAADGRGDRGRRNARLTDSAIGNSCRIRHHRRGVGRSPAAGWVPAGDRVGPDLRRADHRNVQDPPRAGPADHRLHLAPALSERSRHAAHFPCHRRDFRRAVHRGRDTHGSGRARRHGGVLLLRDQGLPGTCASRDGRKTPHGADGDREAHRHDLHADLGRVPVCTVPRLRRSAERVCGLGRHARHAPDRHHDLHSARIRRARHVHGCDRDAGAHSSGRLPSRRRPGL